MRQAWWRERRAWDTAGSSGWPKLGRGGGVRGAGRRGSVLGSAGAAECLTGRRGCCDGCYPSGAALRGQEPDSRGP